ncbi:hypothetical protein [Bacillus cereus group sp. BfR-BA-01349]|uniref:hypothetical protein n=1 Tax=Bacillus cereus group sp. BfR-BA-01349 TaxID=2920312 RepID=UPI001F5A79E4
MEEKLDMLMKMMQGGFHGLSKQLQDVDQRLEKLESKFDVANGEIASLREDVTDMHKQLTAHRIEISNNFIKLYDTVSDKETAIELLNKRVFGTETQIARLEKEKH